MIDMKTIEEEIKKLEESNMTYNVCDKLASLYIIREYAGTSHANHMPGPVAPAMTTPKP